MKTIVVGEVLTESGENVRRYVTTEPRAMFNPIRHEVWATPGSELRSEQPARIPVRARHGGDPIGRITYLERRASGAVWCVAELDGELRADAPVYLSAEVSYLHNGDDVRGTDVTLTGAALCLKSRAVGLHPATVITRGLDQNGKRVSACYAADLIERASRHGQRPWSTTPLVVRDHADTGHGYDGYDDDYDYPGSRFMSRRAIAMDERAWASKPMRHAGGRGFVISVR